MMSSGVTKRRAAARIATPDGRDANRRRATAYYYANPDKCKHRIAAYYADDPESAKRRAIASYAANPEKIKCRVAAYRVTPAGQIVKRRAEAKRRAIKAGATIGDLKAISAWESTWRNKAKVSCHWCKKIFAGKNMVSDHIIPLAKKGSHCVENLAPSCERCNLTKNAKIPESFNATLEQPLLFF